MRLFSAAITAFLALTTPAVADGPVVVELYTSQGCSSCPPADEMLHDLARRSDVIPLALHVDYWDYIGWADSFADPAHTRRQQNYAHAAGVSTIYTPQMIVAGEDHVIGTKPMEVAEAIQARTTARTGVTVALQRAGGRVTITGATQRALPAGTVVQVIRYIPQQTVDIQRGENAGRQLSYANIVTNWDVVGEWSGRDALEMDVAAPGPTPVVVVVQEPGYGAVLASAILR